MVVGVLVFRTTPPPPLVERLKLVAPGIAFLIKEKIVTLSPGWPHNPWFELGGDGGGVCVRCTRTRDTFGLRK